MAFSAMFDQTVVDNADIIHAPSAHTVIAQPHRQRTACGRALRGFSDDITTPLDADFEALQAEGDDRLCWECKSILA